MNSCCRTATVGFHLLFQVASYDGYFSQYYSKTTTKKEGTELSNEMGAHLLECLRHYKSVNNEYPTRVFFYRYVGSHFEILNMMCQFD